MLLFWKRGYDTVSVNQLTEAMGINPPSLYGTFTDKRALFEEAVDAYARRYGGYIDEALKQPDAYGAVQHLLTQAAERCTLPGRPAGCLILSGATNHSNGSAEIAANLRERRSWVEARIESLISADIDAGILPHQTDARALAAYVAVVWAGLSTAARDGHAREQLLNVACHAMNAWPQQPRTPESIAPAATATGRDAPPRGSPPRT